MQVIYCAFLVTAAIISSTTANLCERCKCTPVTTPSAINCECKGDRDSSLVLARKDMGDLESVLKFTASSCNIVTLQTEAFHEAHRLHTFAIDHAHQVSISSDAFSTLSFLMLENVDYLELKEKALYDVRNLTNISIRNTYTPKLPPQTIFNISGLIELKLDNVTIDTVESKAVQLHMEDASSVTIENSKIKKIEEDGIFLPSVNEFTILNSKLSSVARNGINVKSHVSVKFSENVLDSEVTTESINFTSSFINMTANVFNNFPCRLHTRKGDSLVFTNNTILQSNWDLKLLETLIGTSSKDNVFPCKCSYKTRIPEDHSRVALMNWLELNHCNIPCKLSLRKLPGQCKKILDKDSDLCKGTETTTISTTSIMPGVSTSSSESQPQTHSGEKTSNPTALLLIAINTFVSLLVLH